MDAHTATGDDQMEASVTGSTGGTSSVRTGKGAKSSTTRMVTSKYMQAAPPTGHRHEVSGREGYQLRTGGSMGYASLAATPAHAIHAGRSLHLASNFKASGIATSRTISRDTHHIPLASPGGGTTSLTAASVTAPFQLSSALDAAAQERRREQLAKYKQEKAARAGLGAPAAAPTGPGGHPGSSASGAPRVPMLALGILRDGAQTAGDGNRSARGGGVYGSGAGGSAAPVSARGGQIHSARAPGSTRPGVGSAAAAVPTRGGSSAANTAKVPPVPRFPVMPPPGMVEQQLRTAVNAPLPKDEVWDAAQVALPIDGSEEGTTGPAVVKTPSSRITKSPRVVAQGGGGGTWASTGQALPMQPPPPPAHASSQQQPAPIPPRSPPPVSARGAPATSHAAAPSAAGGTASDVHGRVASNAEASTSDTSGRSIKDQIKIAKIQETQWRLLKEKVEAAQRVRIGKGQRQLAGCAMLLTDMMAQCAANRAALETADALKRTQQVLANQLPLLEKWRELQETHGPATREVLTALQNAMTSLPLVNGAALGMGGGDGSQALPQLRRAIANSLGSLQSAEVALGMLLQGVNARASAGGAAGEARGVQGQPVEGGVAAMAKLLPKLHDTLVGEVSNLRALLSNLNALAAKLDEAACLRARNEASALAAPALPHEQGDSGPWAAMASDPAAATWGAAGATAMGNGDGLAHNAAMMNRVLTMLGLGIGDV